MGLKSAVVLFFFNMWSIDSKTIIKVLITFAEKYSESTEYNY